MTPTPQSTPSGMLRPAQGQAASLAPSAIGLAKALAGMGALVGVLALAVAVGCMALWLSESNLVWLVVGAGFLLLGLAGGVGLWAAGRMAAQMARVSLEMGQIARRVEAHTPAAPAPIVTEYAPAPAMHGTEDHQAILDAIEQLRGEVLLTDEQRRDRSTRLAAARVAEAAARFDEDLADGRLEAAQERVSELAALGASPEQVSILRDRVLTFFAERADRAILAGDFRRGQDWIDELAQARPDDRRVVELGTRLREAQASLSAVEFAKQKKYVEDMLAVADYDRAENAVEALVDRLGETEEIKAFAEMVKGEAAAFREEQRRRMLAEVRQFAEARQWRKALGAARDLASEHPRSPQAQEVQTMMLVIEENARIEEVRQLRDRIADLIERKRFAEAVEAAEDVIHRFPDTQVAGQLTREIDKLRRRAGMDDLL